MIAAWTEDRTDFETRMENARKSFADADLESEQLANKAARSRTTWLVPRFSGRLGSVTSLPSPPRPLTVAATDGSQIFPDRHDAMDYYLINVGRIMLTYGQPEPHVVESRPELHFRKEDMMRLLDGRQVHVTADIIGLERTSAEFEELANLVPAGLSWPAVALSDGTLVLWMLEGQAPETSDFVLGKLMASLDRLRLIGVPVGGYISKPGSSEAMNLVRLHLCPLEAADCDHCPFMSEGEPPCSVVAGIPDRVMFSGLLKPGERSTVFLSTSHILKHYGEHAVAFCYLHTGSEVARVEFPQWVSGDLLDLLLACLMDQAEKGLGYPRVLLEAHERAIVRGEDRQALRQLVERKAVKNHVISGSSLKAISKGGAPL